MALRQAQGPGIGSVDDATQIADAFLASAVGGPTGARKRARFHTLRVADIRPLTDAAIEVTFAVPEALTGDYEYLAGQHVALRAEVDGRELRRSYSLCRPPGAGRRDRPRESRRSAREPSVFCSTSARHCQAR